MSCAVSKARCGRGLDSDETEGDEASEDISFEVSGRFGCLLSVFCFFCNVTICTTKRIAVFVFFSVLHNCIVLQLCGHDVPMTARYVT